MLLIWKFLSRSSLLPNIIEAHPYFMFNKISLKVLKTNLKEYITTYATYLINSKVLLNFRACSTLVTIYSSQQYSHLLYWNNQFHTFVLEPLPFQKCNTSMNCKCFNFECSTILTVFSASFKFLKNIAEKTINHFCLIPWGTWLTSVLCAF